MRGTELSVTRRIGGLLAIPLAVAVLAGAGCGGDDGDRADGAGATAETRSVTLALAAPVQVRLFPFTVARERGYFREEGLDVSIEEVDGTNLVMQQVAAGRIEFGYGSSEGTLPAFAEHPDAIRAFYDVFNTGIFQVYALPGSGIAAPKDLSGKTIGVDALNTGEAIFARITAANARLDPREDVQLQPVGDQTAAQVSAIQSERVDAMAAPSDFAVAARVKDIELVCVTCERQNLASSTIVVNNDFLEAKPELVAGFGRAVAKATRFGQDNPDAVLEIMRRAAPHEFTDPEFGQAILKQALEDLSGTQENRYGEIDRQAWETQVKFLRHPEAGEQTLREPVDLDQLLVTDLVEEINDFDPGELDDGTSGR